MSTKSKYPSRKVLVPAALIAALSVTGLLGVTSIAAAQMANTPIQNTIRSSTSQLDIPDNASNYFVLQSQQDLINAVNTGQVKEIFARIEQTASEIEMTSIKDYNIIPESDENKINNTIRVRIYDPGVQNKPAPLLIYLYGRAGEERNLDFFDPRIKDVSKFNRFHGGNDGLQVCTILRVFR
jgi:acetyl esterase/lipase